MSLRNKFCVYVLSLVLVLLGLMAFSNTSTILLSFETIERRLIYEDILRVEKQLHMETEELLHNARHLAAWSNSDQWNGSYDQEPFRTLFDSARLNLLPIEIVVAYNFGTGVLNGYRVDSSKKVIPFSEALSLDIVLSLHRLFKDKIVGPTIEGLLKIGEEYYIVGIVSTPPFSDGTDESRSVILLGKNMADFVDATTRAYGPQYRLLDIESDAASFSAEELSRIVNSGNDVDILFNSNNQATVHYAFTDILGQRDRVFLSAHMKRPIYAIGLGILKKSFVWTSLLGVLTLALVLVIFNRLILRRLENIQRIADNISREWQVNLRIPLEGNDEITRLSRSFNSMLETLEELIKNVPDPLILSDSNGNILLVNVAACQLLGYKKAEDLVGVPLASIVIEEKKMIGPDNHLLRSADDIYEASLLHHNEIFIAVEIHQEILTFGQRPLTLSIARDLTDRKLMEARLIKMAFYDSHTGLPNRHYFLDELEKEINNVASTPNYAASVVLINMDKFKLINEQLGPRNADLVLLETVKRIDGMTAGFASTFRLNGDEFGIILRGTTSKEYVESLLKRLQRLINTPVSLDGKTVFPSASFGVVLDIQGFDTCALILSRATDAISIGKKRGISTITFYSKEEAPKIPNQGSNYNLLTAQADMQKALASSEFVPYFQPIYQLSPQRLIGFETLARWINPHQGLLAPFAFIPLAEETGLIFEIDQFIIQQAVDAIGKWTKNFPEIPLFVSANASGASFKNPEFLSFIENTIQKASLVSRGFVLELTEGILIENLEITKTKLDRMQEFGIKIALDDFGTGYSSLQYVNQLPIDYIKIDKTFIDQLFLSEKNSRMVRSIINMADDLGLGIVAEGVESEDQLHWLAKSPTVKGQGYFFSRPVPWAEAEGLLEDTRAFETLL